MNNQPYDFKHDALMRSIKILDIGYIAAIYFVFAMVCCILIDKFMGKYNEEVEKKKSVWRIWGDTILHMWFIGVLIYIVRNIVELIPFPLDGYQGFQHKKVKELGNAAVFTFILMSYQFYLKGRLNVLYVKTIELFNKTPKIKERKSESESKSESKEHH
jgi:hypothetical protein